MSESSGPRVGDLSQIDRRLWRLGTNPWRSIGAGVGVAAISIGVLAGILLILGSGALFGLALVLVLTILLIPSALVVGIPLGVCLWAVGRGRQATTIPGMVGQFRDLAERRREGYVRSADEEFEAYTLVGEYGSGRVLSDGWYVATQVFVGEDVTWVVEDCELDLRTRRVSFESVARSFPHEDVETVAYESPHLIVRTGDGKTTTFRSRDRPADLIGDLDARRDPTLSRERDHQGEYAMES